MALILDDDSLLDAADGFAGWDDALVDDTLAQELEQERAVIAKEREMQEELRKADRETVRLQAELGQLQLQLTRESTPEQHAKQIPETPDTGITADAAVKNTGRE